MGSISPPPTKGVPARPIEGTPPIKAPGILVLKAL
jgi:hypothetical protein